MSISRRHVAWRASLVVAVIAAMRAARASAATPSPGLTLHVLSAPTHFSEADNFGCFEGPESHPEENQVESCDQYQVTVTNSGDAPTKGPLVVTDHLPPGLHVGTSLFFVARIQLGLETGSAESSEGEEIGGCESLAGETVERCEFGEELQPDQRLELDIRVRVEPGATSGEENVAEASEAGTPLASSASDDVLTPTDTAPDFGVSALVSQITGLDGAPDTQAGDHPYEFVSRFDVNTFMGQPGEILNHGTTGPSNLGAGVRDVVVDLPSGFVGSAQATPKCTLAQLQSRLLCPSDSLVGHLTTEPTNAIDVDSPLYNMVPEHGVAAELGFIDILHGTHVIDATLVPSPTGYELRAIARETPQIILWNAIATLYGDPAAKNGGLSTPAAMFTNPSDCSGEPLSSSVDIDSWASPGATNADGTPNVEGGGWAKATATSPPVTGCNALRFQPEAFSFQPETTTADSPTGATFDLKIPQTETPETLATPPLKDATVALPPGLTVDPSSASGLQTCSEAQIGWLGPVSESNPGFSNFTEAAPTCPEASRVGSVEVTSPLIESTLKGSVYLAAQEKNPYGALFAAYIVIDDEKTGTIVKVPGKLETNEATGQITGVFDDNPQVPFSELKIHFFGGERGDLATPEACGTYTTTSDLEPWSAPESGPNATPSDSFAITNGCVGAFTPAFSAGTTSPQAGAFSPFTLSLGREDDEQGLGGLTVNLPPGLVGKITGVTECSDAQVAAATARSNPGEGAAEVASPSCPESSLLGTVTTQTGPGAMPYSVSGKAYLTGPYKGAPYGMAVIVPAIAGPYDLGVVVIRQALYINPTDTHVTDVSDPFPTIRDGVPLRIKRVSITLSRSNFTLNATSCEPKTINATATSTTNTQTALSARYQAAGCASLVFAPKLTASAGGKGSKANGTSFDVNVTSPGLGVANIAKVDLTLPKALPSRLTTIQKACVASVFEANPASCDEGSVIGMATIHTPLLPDPLTGPGYLVSHGGAAFPDVEFVMQGDNITIVLDGKTDIKKGITYSKFESTPDAPFTTFETVLPAGPHSAFTADVSEKEDFSLCKTPLSMATEITGQNGAVIKQTTKIPTTGCAKAQTTTQKLAAALKACKKDKKKNKRSACEKAAHKKYRTKASKSTNKKKTK